MANAYSIQRNRQGWIDPTDQDFTLKALMFKQQKYDANEAKVDAIKEKYKSLQLARGVDQKYLNERLKYLVDNVNRMGPDYGSNAVTRSIEHHLSQVVDENVMTAAQETAKIRGYQAQVEKIKEKNPELYNPLNEAYGLAPAQEYMQNEQVGAKINGSLNYTPYKDIEGEVNKWLTEVQKNSKDGVTELPDPNNPGQKITVTLNGKSAHELRQLALGFMGDRYNDQLKVNVWGNTGGFKNLDSQVASAIESYNSVVTAKQKELVDIQAKLTGNLTETERETFKTRAKDLENDINETNQMKESLTNNPVGSLVFLEKNKLANRSSMALGMLQTRSVEYSKDDYHFAVLNEARENKKMQLDFAKFETDTQFKAEDLAIKRDELELKRLGIMMKGSEGDGSSSESGTSGGGGIAPGQFVLEEAGLGEGEETAPNYRQMWEQDIQSKRTELSQFSIQSMQTILDVANGRVKADPSKVQAAKAAIAEFQSKGGKLDPKSPKQSVDFMRVVSRADAYSALTTLPIGGVVVGVKDRFRELDTDFSSQYHKYNQARAAAQKAEAAGLKRPYGDNDQFNEVARSAVPFSVSKILNITPNSKQKGTFNQLITMSEEVRGSGQFEGIADDMPVKIKDLRNGKFQVSYYSKAKDGDDNNTNQIRTVTIDGVNAKKVLPQLQIFSKPAQKYTINSMGTKPLYSPTIAFNNPNSEIHQYNRETIAQYSPTAELDVKLLDPSSAKQELIRQTGINALQPKEKEVMNSLISTLLSPQVMDNYRTSVQYGYSAVSPEGIGYTSLVSKSGEKVATVNLGVAQGLDTQVKINQNAPQVTYSKIVLNELRIMMDNYRQTKVLEATPAIKKMING